MNIDKPITHKENEGLVTFFMCVGIATVAFIAIGLVLFVIPKVLVSCKVF